MHIRYHTKETQARLEVDRIAYDGNDNRLLVLSAYGPQQTLRGMQALLQSDLKCRIELEEEGRYSSTYLVKDGNGYRVTKHLLYLPGTWQGLYVSKDPQLLVAGPEALGQALLSDRFTTPLLPEWVPHLREGLEASGLLKTLRGEGCPSALLSAESKDLDVLVSDGINQGLLKIGA